MPLSSEPFGRIGLGSSSGHDPKETLSPNHTRGTEKWLYLTIGEGMSEGKSRCVEDSTKRSF